MSSLTHKRRSWFTISPITPLATGEDRRSMLHRVWVRRRADAEVNAALRVFTLSRHGTSSLVWGESPTDKISTWADRKHSRRSAIIMSATKSPAPFVRGPNRETSKSLIERS
ncbi:unnamed protein product [Laminaria digitata]